MNAVSEVRPAVPACPDHHPAEDTLSRHVSGRLPVGHALVVAAHLRFCASCRAAVRLNETAGGVLLADIAPANLTPDALERTLARLDAPAAEIEIVPPAQFRGIALPAALHALTEPRWRWLAPGIARMTVKMPGAAAREHAWLLRVAPGYALPSHGHSGWEATCVLAGGFTDLTGQYGPGDVAEMDESADHSPVADPGEPCICLIAWDGPLVVRGFMPRLFQLMTGI